MRIKIAISIITLVISSIITLILIGDDSKSESSALLSFSSIPVQSVLKFAYALEDNNSNSSSNSTTNEKLVDEFFEKAGTLANMGNYQEAITWYDKVLAINGNDTAAMNNKGVTLDDLRQLSRSYHLV